MKKGVTTFVLWHLTFLAACTGPEKINPPLNGNVMAAIWAETAANLKRLEEVGAPKAEWAAAVEVPVVEIKSGKELEGVLTADDAYASESDKARARQFLEEGYPMTWFGYCGCQALVIFEREQDKPTFVIRL